MDFNKVYNFDRDKIEHGTWLPFRGGRVKVARINCEAYGKAIDKHQAPYRAVLLSGIPLSSEVARKITIAAMADAILLGWEGFKVDDAEVAYSRDKAEWALTEYPEFRDEIARLSQNEDNFRKEAVQIAAGNSATS